jgi:hypothetical protein
MQVLYRDSNGLVVAYDDGVVIIDGKSKVNSTHLRGFMEAVQAAYDAAVAHEASFQNRSAQ